MDAGRSTSYWMFAQICGFVCVFPQVSHNVTWFIMSGVLGHNPADMYPADTYPKDIYPLDTYPPDTYPPDTYPQDVVGVEMIGLYS